MESDQKCYRRGRKGEAYFFEAEIGSGCDRSGGCWEEEEEKEERASGSGSHGLEGNGQCWDFVDGLSKMGFPIYKK